MIDKQKFGGLVVPMVTPFDKTGKLDEDAISKILRYFGSNGVNAVFLEGTTAEGISLSNSDRIELVRLVLKHKPEKIEVYGVISHHSFKEAVELGRQFSQIGIRYLSAFLPSYYSISDNHVLNYFQRLADSVSNPLVMYNIPQTARTSIPLDVVKKLGQHGNICGIKDSEKGLDRLKKGLSMFAGRDDFIYLIGWANQSVFAMKNGADGIVPGAANLYPRLYSDLLKAVNRGQDELAHKLQADADSISLIYQENKIIADQFPSLKVMMEYYGLCKSYVLLPLMTCSNGQKDKIISQIMQCKALEGMKYIKG